MSVLLFYHKRLLVVMHCRKSLKLAAALVVWNNVSYVSVAEIKGKQRPQMLQPIQIQNIFAICWNVLLFSEN